MHKDDVIAILREMADLLEITEANSFEVMAYRNGAQGLEEWNGDLHQAVDKSTLTDIPSIGKGLSQVITDLIQTSSSDELVRIRGSVPETLPMLLRVRGLGPKRVRALWQELGVESPDDLRRAADEGRIQSLRGFGAKTVERIISSLDYLQKSQDQSKSVSHINREEMPKAPISSGRIWAGTSGYSYPQWKGSFYPDDARSDDLLEHYARQLGTVEINNTFYRFPSVKVIQQWKSQTPDQFHFAIKAHRRITHQLRLSEPARDRIIEFVDRCGQLEARLGCILFQLPPDLSRDDRRLDLLLDCLPSGPRFAVEFRHESWFADDLLEKLRERNVACVSGDAENEAPRQVVTSDFVYARLRRSHYSDEELDSWNEWFEVQRSENRDVLAYLKHDDTGAAPTAIATRWPQEQSAAREMLQQALAQPGRTTIEKKRRRSG